MIKLKAQLRTKKFLIPSLILIASLFIGEGYFFFFTPPSSKPHFKEFIVESGWGAVRTTQKLRNEGYIRSTFGFRVLLTLTGSSEKIKRGIYLLSADMSPLKIIQIITLGQTKTWRLTIPEGYNNRQIGDLLVKKQKIKSREEFLQLATNKALLKKYKIPSNSLEGYLFPETYTLPIDYPKEKMIEAFIKQFFNKIKKIDKKLAKKPKKLHELVIMASIIEREAKIKEERPLIAGVFYNRLRENIPLESCATIQYILPKPRSRLYFKDLEKKSPYNTYKNSGLPPGPISNPGLPALEAAYKPTKTEYKFFVVSGDGAHYFSRTFREHLKAKNRVFGK